MEVGSFGIGSTTGELVNTEDKVDLPTGFYFSSAGIAGLTDVNGSVSILQMGSYSGWRGQIIMSDSKSRMYYRIQSGKTFSKPIALYSENNKPTAADVGALDRIDFPVGSPIAWPLAAQPDGWLKCNGASFDKTKYPALAAAYPSGKLPDLRGEFIRGWDDGRGVDSGRSLLAWQDDMIKKHSHTLGTYKSVDAGIKMPVTAGAELSNSGVGGAMYTGEAGSSETRPRNIAFNYIVRAA